MLMGTEVRQHANGTSVSVRYPFGLFVSARVLCPDGIVRKVKRISATADSYFTVPCAVTVKGKTVAGHLYYSDDVAMFAPYAYRKHAHIFTTEGN